MEHEYTHTHGDKRYRLFYIIECRLHRNSYNTTWSATLEGAYDVTGFDNPDEDERWTEVRFEDLPSRPTEQDVIDSYSEDAWDRISRSRLG